MWINVNWYEFRKKWYNGIHIPPPNCHFDGKMMLLFVSDQAIYRVYGTTKENTQRTNFKMLLPKILQDIYMIYRQITSCQDITCCCCHNIAWVWPANHKLFAQQPGRNHFPYWRPSVLQEIQQKIQSTQQTCPNLTYVTRDREYFIAMRKKL